MPILTHPLSPIWRSGGVPFRRSTVGKSSSLQRRRASTSCTRSFWVGRHPCQVVREGTRGLEVQPGGPVRAGIELGVVLPGPALKEGTIDDQLGGGVQVLHRRHAAFQAGGDKRPVGGVIRKAVLGDAVELSEQFLEQAMLRADQRQTHTGSAPGSRTPATGDLDIDRPAQIRKLTANYSRTSIHEGGLFSE